MAERSLAKEMKIRNLIFQREFIREQLMKPRKDGDASYQYIGCIFPEVLSYFREEGYVITEFQLKDSEVTGGKPIYLFEIPDDIVLTEEEMKESENYMDPVDADTICKILDRRFQELEESLGKINFGEFDE